MKIAILTLPPSFNYGGILQAYALSTVLKRMGHDVEVLFMRNRNYPFAPILLPVIIGKRIVKKVFFDWKTPILVEKKKNKEQSIVFQHTLRFIKENLECREIKNLKSINESDYDAFVVGSDQIWRKPYFNSMWYAKVKDAYLDFTRGWNIRRVSYAASFGLDNINEYSERDVRECSAALKMFDSVSVREDSGVLICEKELGVKAFHVLDPTMLLNKCEYEKLVEKKDLKKSSGDMLCYILDNTQFKEKIKSKIVEKYNLKPFYVSSDVENLKISAHERIQPPLELWLRAFIDSKLIVTDSFHATVFSIIFGKPFIAIGNARRGLSRFTSLMNTFSLQHRLILTEEDFDNVEERLFESIDLDLRSKQLESFSFLNRVLTDS